MGECAGAAYVVDTNDDSGALTASTYIRKIVPATQGTTKVTTLAGGPRSRTTSKAFDKSAMVDGQGLAARFGNVVGITCHPTTGVAYVIDSDFLRQIGPDGSVSTIAGWGGVDSKGFGIDGSGQAAGFAAPRAIRFSGGDLLIADAHVIRRVTQLPAITPPSTDVLDGSYRVTAHVFGVGATGRSIPQFTLTVSQSSYTFDQSPLKCPLPPNPCATRTKSNLIDNQIAVTYPITSSVTAVLGGRLYATPNGATIGLGFLGDQVSGVFGYWTATQIGPALNQGKLSPFTSDDVLSIESGWYWDPAQAGRGYMIEQQGANIFLAGFLYSATGAPIWYAAGPGPLRNGVFSNTLTAYTGGQTLTGPYKPPTQSMSQGPIQFDFSTGNDFRWGGGNSNLQRYGFGPGAINAQPASNPETGWWWNPDQGGRGFGIEVQNGTLFMAGYMYDQAGNPIWYVSGPTAMVDAKTYQGTWKQFANGQVQAGPYRAPVEANSNVGSVNLVFTDTRHAQLTLPNGSRIALVRYDFAGDSLAQLYKARRGPDFETDLKTVAQQIAELQNIEVLRTNTSGSTVNYLGYAWNTQTGAITYQNRTTSFLDALKCGIKGCATISTPISTDPTVTKAKQCIAAYAGGTLSPQGDTLCQQAYLDECLDKATGSQTYKPEVDAVCHELTVYPQDRCPYCPYRTLP